MYSRPASRSKFSSECQQVWIWVLKALHKWHFIVFPAYYVILKIAAYLRAKQYVKCRPFGSLEGKRVLFGHFHHIKEKNRLQDWSWNLRGRKSAKPSLWIFGPLNVKVNMQSPVCFEKQHPLFTIHLFTWKTVLLMPACCLVYREFRRQTPSS